MNRMIHTGAVYCRMMVLAAVVSLLATMYSVVMANVLIAPSSTARFHLSRWCVSVKKTANTIRLSRLRTPLMVSGDHGISLQSRPPVENSSDAHSIIPTPRRALAD